MNSMDHFREDARSGIIFVLIYASSALILSVDGAIMSAWPERLLIGARGNSLEMFADGITIAAAGGFFALLRILVAG